MNNRRHFLASTTVAAGAALLVERFAMKSSVASSFDAGFKVAILSDTHTSADVQNEYRGFKPFDNLQQVIEQIVPSKPEVALICGDAARLQGHVADYERLKELLTPLMDQVPTHIALGNHDDRANFIKVFAPQKGVADFAGRKHVTVADLGPQRWIVLDSLMYVDKVPGLLGTEQRNWLDKTLGEAINKPTFLMVHHTLGAGDGDLLDSDRLFAIVEKHPHVHGIVFGHSHHWGIEKRDNLHLINLPAIGYNFNDKEPVGWVEASLHGNKLELVLRAVGGNREHELQNATIEFGGKA